MPFLSSPHRRAPARLTVLAAAVALGCTGAGVSKKSAAGAEPAGGAVTIWTDSTELFMEHPALIVGVPDRFAVHLTDLSDFAPLRSGRVTLRFDPKDGGAPLVVVQDAPRLPGIYGPAPEFTRPGIYDLTITVESPQAHDLIGVPDLRVYASPEEAPKEAGDNPGGILFLKEQQWKTPGFATAFATTGTVTESFPATGEIIPAAGRLAIVAAPIAGLVEASGVAASPAPGQRVAKGQVLAVLTPTLGEGGSAFAEARANLHEAEAEQARAERLYAAEAIPERRLRHAKIRLTAAREALAGLAGGGATRADGKLVVRSPISGVVAARSIAPGSRTDAGTELFTVVDPSLVWLRVNVPANDAPRVGKDAGATFSVPGTDHVYRSRRALSVGSVIDSVSRTVPVIFQVPNPDGALKIGAAARVSVGTSREVKGVVVPTSAVLDEDGRPVGYVQAEGERFEKRELAIGGSESQQTVVTAGVRAGERVVTGAPYQVRLASLSTSVPAHGHEH